MDFLLIVKLPWLWDYTWRDLVYFFSILRLLTLPCVWSLEHPFLASYHVLLFLVIICLPAIFLSICSHLFLFACHKKFCYFLSASPAFSCSLSLMMNDRDAGKKVSVPSCQIYFHQRHRLNTYRVTRERTRKISLVLRDATSSPTTCAIYTRDTHWRLKHEMRKEIRPLG